MDVSEYCRDIEAYLCRKNDGHLMRIVGPSFELVSRWAVDGVPLKVALAGIDRYFERYYRKGPRRRPVKIDFCEADVLDLFDEWRRATGATPASPLAAGHGDEAPAPRRKGPSMPEHLERVVMRLSSLRATGALDDAADPLVDRIARELDVARSAGAGVRGEARRALIERLAHLDTELGAYALVHAPAPVTAALREEALADLAGYRATMAPDAFAAAVDAATVRLLRQRLGLPTVRFE